MSEFLSETEGCDLLARLFRARGYSIARNQLFREYGVEFHIDGWDAKARVGFEFLSSEDDDHDDLNLAEYQTLAAAQQRGELALFIIDEVEPLSTADLALQANDFLDEVAEARRSRPLAAPVRKSGVHAKRRLAGKASQGVAKGTAKAGKKPVKKSVEKPAKKAGKKTAKKAVKKADAKRIVTTKKAASGKPRVTATATKKRPAPVSRKTAGKQASRKR